MSQRTSSRRPPGPAQAAFWWRRSSALGSLVARALSGSWRTSPAAVDLSPGEFTAVSPTLHATACAGLAWWRVRGTSLDALPSAGGCRDAYRFQSLEARVHEERLARALLLFGSAGVRPVLAKGPAIARIYPSPGLRPYGDLDLHVAPEDFEAARTLLRENPAEAPRVDLHPGLPRLGRPWTDVEARCREVDVGALRVRVLGPEDHLALLCVHLLSHGAWRPLWLCDVALFLEELPQDFDWDYLRELPERQVEEVRLVALMAHRLLGARLDRTPWRPEEGFPGWLPRAIMAAWGRGGHYSVTTRIALAEGAPGRLLEAVRIRWPNPVEATVRWRAPYNGVPRLPYQILDAAVRGVRALVEAPRVLARRWSTSSPSDEEV